MNKAYRFEENGKIYFYEWNYFDYPLIDSEHLGHFELLEKLNKLYKENKINRYTLKEYEEKQQNELSSNRNGLIKYKEILKLKEMLDKENIEYSFRVDVFFEGYGIKYPNDYNLVYSIIEHNGSYGHEKDLLELMSLKDVGTNEYIIGSLTAEEVFEKIKNHEKNNLKGE